MGQPTGEVRQKNETMTRSQQARAEHDAKTSERLNDLREVRNSFREIKDTAAIKNLVNYISTMVKMNEKIARDGVGARRTGYKLQNGQEEVENVFLSKDERVAKLDRAAGQQDILDYLLRQTGADTDESEQAEPAKPEEATENPAAETVDTKN